MTDRLTLEVRGAELADAELEQNTGPVVFTPDIGEDFWTYRVRLGANGQAIVGFPKFFTVGIGFAQEEDWNTNFPWTIETEKIYDHIEHNKADDSISREDCLTAIRMIQDAVKAAKAR